MMIMIVIIAITIIIIVMIIMIILIMIMIIIIMKLLLKTFSNIFNDNDNNDKVRSKTFSTRGTYTSAGKKFVLWLNNFHKLC